MGAGPLRYPAERGPLREAKRTRRQGGEKEGQG